MSVYGFYVEIVWLDATISGDKSCYNPAHQPPPPPPQASESQLKETLLNLASPTGHQVLAQMGLLPREVPAEVDAEETCYLLKGRVKAYPKGSSESVEFGAGDLVTIPKGLSCTWDGSEFSDRSSSRSSQRKENN
ncbi:RmlC-like cupins superfamily protein [Prunus dulcis]|uniref:RmlC-like cupins superfamily protein n=1 Tax=Prunus dulcis TaxID=3755 RepID=A0A4Y1S068_PRUDU|nr:RmlC-like cupins superfamily protein [Prunus dulcis]